MRLGAGRYFRAIYELQAALIREPVQGGRQRPGRDVVSFRCFLRIGLRDRNQRLDGWRFRLRREQGRRHGEDTDRHQRGCTMASRPHLTALPI